LFYYHKNKPKNVTDQDLINKIRRLREDGIRLGAKKLAKFLSTNAQPVNHKKIARILKENDLNIMLRRRRKYKQYNIERLPQPKVVDKTNSLWSIDFMCSRKSNKFRFMLLNMVDVSSRESPGMVVERSFTSLDVTQELERSIQVSGKPEGIVTDNGVEFTAGHFRRWCKANKITHYLTNKSSPSENSYVESFNSVVRREVLDANDFESISSLRRKINKWKTFYNEQRPHGSLDYLSPKEYIRVTKNRRESV